MHLEIVVVYPFAEERAHPLLQGVVTAAVIQHVGNVVLVLLFSCSC